jgi:WD40 repeat protein
VFVNGLVSLPGGKLAAVYNYDHKDTNDRHARIVLWDVRGKKAETLYEHRGSTFGLAPSPDGALLAATLGWSADFNGLKVWDLKRREVVWQEKVGDNFLKDDFMSTILWSPDGKRLAVGGGHSVQTEQGGYRAEGRLWMYDVKTRKRLWYAREPGNWTYSRVVFTADGKGLLTGSSGRIVSWRKGGMTDSKVLSELRRWDAVTGKVVWKTEGELGDFHALAVSTDGKAVAGSDDAQLTLFDPETGALRQVLARVQGR